MMLGYEDDFDRCLFCADKAEFISGNIRACADCAETLKMSWPDKDEDA